MATELAKITADALHEPSIRQIIDFFTSTSKYLLEHVETDAHREAGVLLQTASNLETILSWKEDDHDA